MLLIFGLMGEYMDIYPKKVLLERLRLHINVAHKGEVKPGKSAFFYTHKQSFLRTFASFSDLNICLPVAVQKMPSYVWTRPRFLHSNLQ